MKDIMRLAFSGLSLLPEEMNTPEARAMLRAIGLQESQFKHRFQVGGPAKGFWQFEKGGGIKGVLNHPTVKEYAQNICKTLCIPATESDCYEAIAYNDPLACCFARLLLYTIPAKLPLKSESQKGWDQYIVAWRPGEPRSETWSAYFNLAWLYD